MEERITEALSWITSVLRSHGIPFQAVGGLAARGYGATRPLVDLDFYISEEGLATLLEEVSPWVRRAPAHHEDEDWSLTFAQLRYAGVKIELGVADGARYWNSKESTWEEARVDFDASEVRPIAGIEVPLMPRDQLVEYKKALDRPVDRIDLVEMLQARKGAGGE